MPVDFDGDEYFEVGPPTETFTGATVTAWIYSLGDDSDGFRVICTRQEEPPNDTSNQFLLRTDDGTLLDWRCRNTVGGTVTCSDTITLATWTFLTGSVANGGKTRLYKNAVLEQEEDFLNLEPTVNNIIVGADKDGATYATFWKGEIADVRVYNRQLTTGEIVTIYNTKGLDNIVDGLVMRLPLNEKVSGTVDTYVQDVSKNKYTVTPKPTASDPDYVYTYSNPLRI